jgi:hypothetical protein
MTRVEVVREVRERLDREDPRWRDALRRRMDAEQPGWVAAVVKVMTESGEAMEVAVLARPERVPDPSEIDPATDPFSD